MKKFFVISVVCAMAVCCFGCGIRQPERIQRTDTAMGTVIKQDVYTTEKNSTPTEEIQELLRSLEEEELSRRLETSDIWKVNEAAGREEGSELSPELSEILQECLEVWEQSEGAFDVTIGSVVELWDIDDWASGEREGIFVLPENELLQEALGYCGSENIRLNGKHLFLPEGMQIDLGAVGKGIALDAVLIYLQENEKITGATIAVGGSVLTYGKKPDGSSWKVGIVNPRETFSYVGILELDGQWCISTSGDYERYVEVDGIRYHHIIDPDTGYPADSGVISVTVLTKDGFLSDALSTACFILGKDVGMKLAESYGAEVLFVEKDGTVSMTEGMREVCTLTSGEANKNQ